jgi:hypothetical protein
MFLVRTQFYWSRDGGPVLIVSTACDVYIFLIFRAITNCLVKV